MLKTDTAHRPNLLMDFRTILFLNGKVRAGGGHSSCIRRRAVINIFVSESSFLHILKKLIQCLKGSCIRVMWRKQIFYRICAFQTRIQCFHGGHRIFCNCDFYGFLTFLTFVLEKLPEYSLFFCKMWIITYVGKVKNSVIIYCVLLSFRYYLLLSISHLYSSLEFFKKLDP